MRQKIGEPNGGYHNAMPFKKQGNSLNGFPSIVITAFNAF